MTVTLNVFLNIRIYNLLFVSSERKPHGNRTVLGYYGKETLNGELPGPDLTLRCAII
jgi:hypothetical protein